jgi:hypothetical protein
VLVALTLLATSSAFCPAHRSAAIIPSLVLKAENVKEQVKENAAAVKEKVEENTPQGDELLAIDDGGETPSDEEKKKIKKIKRNVVVTPGTPASQKLGFSQFRLGFEGLFRRSNKLPYALFEQVRKGTEVSYMELDQVDFSDDTNDTLFYKTKKETKNDFMVARLYRIFKYTPFMRAESGIIDYEELIGPDFFEPFQRMMKAKTPEECFLKQAAAFCKQESATSNRLVCDLGFMSKYQVNRKSAGRYGGKVAVERGRDGKGYQIVEVDGKDSTSKDFESAKGKFLSSFGVYLIVLRHAVMTHLAISQRLLVRLTTNRTQGYKDAWTYEGNRGPYTLLRALATRTNEVSINEQLLIGPGTSRNCVRSLSNSVC